MPRTSSRLESLAIGATLLRLPLALLIIASINSPVVSVCFLVAFVSADLFDGLLARHLGVDTDLRRAWDSTLDRIAVHLVLYFSVLLQAPGLFWLYSLVALRDFIGSLICAHAYLRRHHRFMILGGRVHAGWSLGAAAFFVAIQLGPHGVAVSVGILFLIASWILLFDYIGTFVAATKGIVSPASDQSCRIYSLRLAGLRYLLACATAHRRRSALARIKSILPHEAIQS